MKLCTSCSVLQPVENFPVNRSRCKSCRDKDNSQRKARWYKEHREVSLQRARKFRASLSNEQKQRYRETAKDWWARNHSHTLTWRGVYREQHRGRVNAWAKNYRAKKRLALPSWASLDKIEAIYREAARLSEGISSFHVDHIVPLQSDTVCGLHWEGNLQILPAAENISKGNRRWPDMW